jgi:putative nucleotidyltransferase with HDIG domain
MLSNIMEHSIEVTKVALFLSMELNKKGQHIDLALVEAASLLHDLTKTECLETREDHAQTGYQFLKKIGYEEVGKIVAEHIHLVSQGDPQEVSEKEVVNYTDKRVQHHRIVSLEERFQDLKDRYARTERVFELFGQLEKETFEIEAKIFSILGIDPKALQHLQGEGENRIEVDRQDGLPP